MTSNDIIAHVTHLLASNNGDEDLTARQLRRFISNLETIVSQAAVVAPCEHDGAIWFSRGKTHCGLCSRQVEE